MDHDPPPTPPSTTAPWPTAAQIVGAGQSAKDACTKSIVSATVRAGYDGGRVGTHQRARGICRRGSPQQGPQPGAPLAVPGSPEPLVASTRPHPSVVPGWGLVRAVSGEGGGRYHSETQLESPLGYHGNYDTHQYSHTASRTTREPHTTSQAKLPHDHQRAPPPVPGTCDHRHAVSQRQDGSPPVASAPGRGGCGRICCTAYPRHGHACRCCIMDPPVETTGERK